MASEILQRDQNHVTVIGAITDNAAQEIRMLRVDPVTNRVLVSVTGAGSGTVTSVSVVTANGFSGSVATATTTPAITLSTTNTQGSVLFAGTAGQLQQDNANFFWDDTNNRLGIGTATPIASVHILETSGAATPGTVKGIVITQQSSGNDSVGFQNAGSSNKAWSFYQPGNSFSLYEYAAGQSFEGTGADRIFFQAGGNIGIGTTAPLTNLQISGGASNVLSFNTASGGSNTTQGAVRFYGNLVTNPTTRFSQIRGVTSTTSATVGLAFDVATGDVLNPNVMVISDTGNIGIGVGTTTPVGKVAILGTSTATLGGYSDINIGAGTTLNNYVGISFYDNSSPRTNRTAFIGFQTTSTTGSGMGDLVFATRSLTTDTAPTETMRILANGNIGIGTASPNAKIESLATTEQLRLSYDATHFASFTVNSTGDLQFSAASGAINASGTFSVGSSIQAPFISNSSSSNNSKTSFNTTGTVISRNIADANAALIVNQSNASSTGLIQQWQFNSSGVAGVTTTGVFAGAGMGNSTTTANALINTSTTGTVISRNIADANVVLIVNQSNASSTGDIQDWQFNSIKVASINTNGTLTVPQAILTANAITATANAATIPITSGRNIVTNNSAATLTVTLATSGAVNMQTCVVQILDFSGVAQTLTLVNTENSTTTAPATTNGSTTSPLTLGLMFNSQTSKWRILVSA